jgi:hypothetical protein
MVAKALGRCEFVLISSLDLGSAFDLIDITLLTRRLKLQAFLMM